MRRSDCFRISPQISSFCRKYLLPFVEQPTSSQLRDQPFDGNPRASLRQRGSQLQFHNGIPGNLVTNAVQLPRQVTSAPSFVVNEQHLRTLTEELGFPREQAENALRRTNNNIDAATNLLLDG